MVLREKFVCRNEVVEVAVRGQGGGGEGVEAVAMIAGMKCPNSPPKTGCRSPALGCTSNRSGTTDVVVVVGRGGGGGEREGGRGGGGEWRYEKSSSVRVM